MDLGTVLVLLGGAIPYILYSFMIYIIFNKIVDIIIIIICYYFYIVSWIVGAHLIKMDVSILVTD